MFCTEIPYNFNSLATGPDAVPGFWHLESSVHLGKDYYGERVDYQRFELVVHESEFERIP